MVRSGESGLNGVGLRGGNDGLVDSGGWLGDGAGGLNDYVGEGGKSDNGYP